MTFDKVGKSNTGFLFGERIYLRPLEKEDLKYIKKWSNDSEIRKQTGEVTPMTYLGAEHFFEKVSQTDDRIWFVIVLKENDRVIGETGLLRMFHPWRTTDLSIILGEKDMWGKGYGTEAILLLLDYAFGYLNFNRVSIGVVGFNESALRFYEKIGFKKEGIQREGYYFNYNYYDFIMMSFLQKEFRELYPKDQLLKG